MRKTALIYVRRSVVKSASDEVSPEQQRVLCVAEAERQGWSPEVYKDAEGHRSGRTEQRPGWLTLKAQLDRPDVAAVIVESLSRASRSIKDLFTLIEELEKRQITLISLKERVDTSTAIGRAFVGFIAVLNQFESDMASERMTDKIAYRREDKGRHWGLTPFGCEREGPDRVLVPSKEGAIVNGVWRGYHEALRVCYEWYVEGTESLATLRDRLNKAGYRFRDRRGAPRLFTEDDVRRLLAAHRLYAGYVLDGRAKDGVPVLREGSHAPILPVELCDRVAERLEERSHLSERFKGRHGPGRVYLLSDLLYCAACGQRMIGQWQDGKSWYRHHRRKEGCPAKGQVRCDVLDAQVFALLEGFKMPDELKARVMAEVERRAALAGRPEWERLHEELKRNRQRLENLKELRIEGEIDREEYYRRKEKIEAAIAEAEARLSWLPNERTTRDLLARIDHVAEVIATGTLRQQKEIMNTLFERIEQRDGQIERFTLQLWARGFL